MEVNSNKTGKIEELGTIDIQPLKELVLSTSPASWDTTEDFDVNYNKKRGAALEQAEHIILSFTDKRQTPFTYYQSKRWAVWNDVIKPVLEEIAQRYGYEDGFFPKVMLAKLPPKGMIPPHVDGDERGYVPHKIHIPLFTNPEAYFYLESERFHFEEGKGYEVNNGLKHSVLNGGSTDRIHLIVEHLNVDEQPEELQREIYKSRKLYSKYTFSS